MIRKIIIKQGNAITVECHHKIHHTLGLGPKLLGFAAPWEFSSAMELGQFLWHFEP